MLPKIATPKYDMIVPSTGEKVTYRPYLIKEEKILMMALESQEEKQIEQAILDMLKSCVDMKMKSEDLTTFDVEYMFLKLRAVSVGETATILPPCESCEKPGSVTINLNDVEVQGLKKFKNEMQVKLSDELTVDMHYPKMGDAIKAETGTDTIIGTVSKCIDMIYYGEDTYNTKDSSDAEVQEFVENLNSNQFKAISKVLEDTPYVGETLKWTCKECGHKHSQELRGLTAFFI